MQLSYKIAFFVLIASTAQATNKVGNGGDGIFCKTDPKGAETGEILDFYENKINFESTEADPYKIAAQRFETLRPASPKLATQYLKRLKEMPDEIEFKNEIKLTNIKDSNHLVEPLAKDCRFVQVAIRKTKKMPGEPQFLIREDLWKSMKPVQRAGLLTHEIIYEHFSKLGEEDSVKARKLNRYLYNKDFTSLAFWTFIKDLDIPIYP